MILGVSSCSKDKLDERLIGTWESESAFIVIKKDKTMKMMRKDQDRHIAEGPISTEDGGLLYLKEKSMFLFGEDKIITFFDYEIINSENVRIDNSVFTRRGGIKPKEGALPLGVRRGDKKLEGEDKTIPVGEIPEDLLDVFPDNKISEIKKDNDGNYYWGNPENKIEKNTTTNQWEVLIPGSGWYVIDKEM